MYLCFVVVDCGDPGAPSNGNRSFVDTLEGSVVTYSCNSGFELVGNRTQICELTPDGASWSFTRPQCMCMVFTQYYQEMYLYSNIVPAVRCGDPGTPVNGMTVVTSDAVGSTATHSCNDGFNINGVSDRTCLSNGSWSDSLPSCVRK